jgi:hypothetical protein
MIVDVDVPMVTVTGVASEQVVTADDTENAPVS